MNFKKILIGLIFVIFTISTLYIGLQYLFGFILVKITNLHTKLTFNLLHKLFLIKNKVKFEYNVIITVFYYFSIILTLILPILVLISMIIKPKKKLHGNTRFASLTEINKSGLIKNKNDKTTDILLAKVKNKYLRLSGQLSTFVAAAPRTGKGWSIVLPNLVHFQGSIVVIDLKYENFIKTAGFRKKSGYEVYILNPEGFIPIDELNNTKFRSHCWNPFTYVSKDPILRYQDLFDIANILYPIKPNDKNKFFTESAQILFIAICMYMLDKNLELTMANVLRIATVNEESDNINEYLKTLSTQSNINQDTKLLLQQLTSGNIKTINDVLSTFKVPLHIFIDKRIEAITSNDSFDLRNLRKKKMIIYVCVQPTKIDTFSYLIKLFFSQIITEIEKQGLPENNNQLQYQCLLLLDEFYSLGYMPQIQKAISVLPGYNLRCLVIIQNKNQLYEIYGKEGAESFLKYFHTFIIFTPNNQQDAEEYSQMLGYATLSHKSKSFSRSRNYSSTINITDQKRAVMLPDELKLMLFKNCIIYSQYNLPIFAEKIIYKYDKNLKDRFNLPIPHVPILSILTKNINLSHIKKSHYNNKLDTKKVLTDLLIKLDDKEEFKKVIFNQIQLRFDQ